VDLVRDLSDKLVLDRNGREIGRVDRVLLDLSTSPPRVVGFEIGPAVLAARLSTLLGRWVAGLERALGIDRDRPLRIEVAEIIDRSPHIRVDRLFADTPACLVENNLQRRLPRWPGAA
jgi:sporulation protein YlmC with PRC-barrel domain